MSNGKSNANVVDRFISKYFKKYWRIAPTNRLLDLMENCGCSVDSLFLYCLPSWVCTSDSRVGLKCVRQS
ncbi:hypothetical protein Hdeb2414_s0010g00347701 [Helianthus debilis subsp. tardiflorus]